MNDVCYFASSLASKEESLVAMNCVMALVQKDGVLPEILLLLLFICCGFVSASPERCELVRSESLAYQFR